MTNKFARVIVVNQDGDVLAVCQPKADVQNYCFPGGKVERAESPKAAASRELYEELGIRVSQRRLHHCLTSKFDFGGKTWTGHFYVCTYGGKRPTLLEQDKISSAEFYRLDELASLPCDKPSFVEVATKAENKISVAQAEIAHGRLFA